MVNYALRLLMKGIGLILGATVIMIEPCAAGPDFSQSSLTPSVKEALESSVVRFDAVLRNTGDSGGEPTYFNIDWPVSGFFIGLEGADNTEIDYEWRSVSGYVSLPPGGERRLTAYILTPLESKREILSVSLRVADLQNSVEEWFHEKVTTAPRPHRGGVKIGSTYMTKAGVVFFSWIGGSILLWLMLSLLVKPRLNPQDGRWKPVAITFLLMMPIGFWLIFAGMARRDYQILHTWPETEGTVMGRRIEVSESSSSSKRTASGRRKTDYNYSPILALRYTVNGKETYSSGYDSGSFLRKGGRAQREKELAEWPIGGKLRCWYNPEDPLDVVIRQGFGGAYFFALFPLPFFIAGVIMLRKVWRR